MCGRYYRRSDKQRIAEAYRLGEIPFDLVLPDWDFNIAPTTFQPVIRSAKETGQRELVLMRWGLVPIFYEAAFRCEGHPRMRATAIFVLSHTIRVTRIDNSVWSGHA
jgi:putative SOS response-associated peptidase YedK